MGLELRPSVAALVDAGVVHRQPRGRADGEYLDGVEGGGADPQAVEASVAHEGCIAVMQYLSTAETTELRERNMNDRLADQVYLQDLLDVPLDEYGRPNCPWRRRRPMPGATRRQGWPSCWLTTG